MAIDAGIFGQVGQGVRSVQDYDRMALDAQNAQLGQQQNRLALLLNQQKADEYQRGIQEQNRLRGLAQGWGADTTDEQRVAGLKNAGFFQQADSLEKGMLERQKTGADTAYKGAQTQGELVKNQGAEYDLKRKKFEHTVQGLSQFQDPQQAKGWLADSVANGMMDQGTAMKMVSGMPTDPAQFAKWRDSGVLALMDAGKQAGFIRPDANAQLQSQTQLATNQLTNDTSRQNNAATVAATMRGQNMTDARSRESNAASLTKPFEVTGSDGLPVLVQQDKQGNITPVQGFGPKSGSAKPLNDTQAKALLFGTRMQESNKIIEGLQGKYSPGAINAKAAAENLPIVGGIAGVVGNAALSDEGQQAEQAQRDFINAVLRRESGAVISPSEFAEAKRQYFPQPNDKPQNLKQKANNRQLAINGLLAEVPEGRRQSITPKPAAAPDSDIDALLKKYGGK